jgi:ABC-type proline/glycine betaine transport system permease subunit
MPITYVGMNDRWIKAMNAIVLVFVLILFIWGIGLYLGCFQADCNSALTVLSSTAQEIMS